MKWYTYSVGNMWRVWDTMGCEIEVGLSRTDAKSLAAFLNSHDANAKFDDIDQLYMIREDKKHD
jgi:hypothetical protein